MYEKITSANYIMYAIKHYENPHCENEKEFYDDMKKFKYIKRLLRKYKETNVLKDRLILNLIIIFYNVFGIEAASRILFSRIEKELHSYLKTFLLFLNYLPEIKELIPELNIEDIPIELNIAKKLREI